MFSAVAVLGKNIWGPGPSSFGRQQRLSEIPIESIKNFGVLGKIWGPVPPGPNIEPPLVFVDLLMTSRSKYRSVIRELPL